MKLRIHAAALATMLLATVFAAPARADDEADKLSSRGKALRYSVKTTDPSNAIDTGGAAIFVNAPIAEVRQIVTDYRHYAQFIKPFEQSKLISKKDGVSEVYFEVPVLHGAAKIWAVVKFAKPVKDGDGEKIVARYGNKGNVDDFRAVWRLRAVDETHTIVKCEIFVDPKMPLPPSMLTPELSYAADKASTAVRDRAEQAAGTASRTSDAGAAKKPSNVAKR
jgi:ribosome-associated toxin RatA of RatAB toxin-antitoxin module